MLVEAYEYIYSIIEEDGPFDGVMGFSQGAALASSLIIRHTRTHSQPIVSARRVHLFLLSVREQCICARGIEKEPRAPNHNCKAPWTAGVLDEFKSKPIEIKKELTTMKKLGFMAQLVIGNTKSRALCQW